MPERTVAVVIPYSTEHTPERLLERALDSVESQTIPTEPIVVTDDQQRGPAWARNVGLDRASARFVAFCDADDYWKARKLETQLDALAETGAGLCLTQTVMQESGETNVEPFETTAEFAEDILFRRSQYVMSSLLIDTDRVQPRFDESLACYEDYLFAIQAASEGACFVSDAVTIIHRHDEGLSAEVVPTDTRLGAGIDYFEQAVEAMPALEAREQEYVRWRYHRAGRGHYFDGDYQRSVECLRTALSHQFHHRTLVALLISSVYNLLDR